MTDTQTELYQLVKEARARCAIHHVPRYQLLRDLDEDGEREFILGSCDENARILSDYINTNTDYTARIIRGGLKLRDEPVPSSFSEAERDGTVHYWVEVTTPEGVFHVDVAEERYAVPEGSPYVGRTPPQNYIRF